MDENVIFMTTVHTDDLALNLSVFKGTVQREFCRVFSPLKSVSGTLLFGAELFEYTHV
jgi:hypothetical protein